MENSKTKERHSHCMWYACIQMFKHAQNILTNNKKILKNKNG